MFKNYLKTAWRNIINQRINSLINIGSLSVAMAAVVIITIWIQNELSFDNYHTEVDKIYLLKNYWQFDKNERWVDEKSYYPMAGVIKLTVPEVDLVTQMDKISKGDLTLTVNEKRFKEDAGIYVDSNWFKVFRYTFIKGSAVLFAANTNSVAFTETKAKKIFGKTDVIGSIVRIHNEIFSVQAVVEDNPINSSLQFDVILPFDNKQYDISDWRYSRCRTFIKVKPHANVSKIEAKINSILKANNKADGSITTTLLPLEKLHFDNNFQRSAFIHGNSKTVKIFGILALLLLFTAAINYVNLSMARTSMRLKEMTIRKITGATRLQLFIQLMAESVVTAIVALFVTTVIVILCLPLVKPFTSNNFSFNLFSASTIFILTGTLLSIILLTGIYPAIILSFFNPLRLFKGSNVPALKTTFFKKFLIPVQFAVAIFMMIATIVVYRQLTFIQNQDVAYNRSQVFTVKVPSSIFQIDSQAKRESMLNALKQQLTICSAIKTVSRTSISSLVNENFLTSNGVNWDGKPQDTEPSYVPYTVEPDINNIMHFKILEGRWFTSNNAADTRNVVLNETAVKRFRLNKPVVGKRFNDGIIIGVVKDFYYKSMREKIDPVVMRIGKPVVDNFVIQANTGKAKEALAATRIIWQKYFPSDFFDYVFANDEFDTLYKNEQKALTFTIIFSGLSILICCTGLLGMAILLAEQRRKEIAIRKILGASVTGLIIFISKDFLKLVFIAILIATPAARWAMDKWLQDYAYRTDIGSSVFFLAGTTAIFIAFATICFNVTKVAFANPVKSLRTE